MKKTGRSWVDGNVSAFTPAPDGSVNVLGTDGNLWKENIGWVQRGRSWVDG
jgi:hypothetical protein